MIAGAALMSRGVNTQWQADQHAEQDGQGGQFQRGREHSGDVFDHRMAGQQRLAQITVQQVLEVHDELGGQWLVQPQFLIGLGIGGRVCIRSDDGQYRVQRHDPADEESEQQQAEQGRRH